MPGSGPKIRAGRDCPRTAGELLDLGESLHLLLYLAGLEHNLDYPPSLIPLVKWWKDQTRTFAFSL